MGQSPNLRHVAVLIAMLSTWSIATATKRATTGTWTTALLTAPAAATESATAVPEAETKGESALTTENNNISTATTKAATTAETQEAFEATTMTATEATTMTAAEDTTMTAAEATTMTATEATTMKATEATIMTATEATTMTATEATTMTAAEATTMTATEASATQQSPRYCHLRLHSNLFECNGSNIHQSSKSDDNQLNLRLPVGSSKRLCCRGEHKVVRGTAESKMVRINCTIEMLRPGEVHNVIANSMHCYDRCNTTVSLDSSRRYYSLSLPVDTNEQMQACFWRLVGVNQVSISANTNLQVKFPRPFLCLTDGNSKPADSYSVCFNSLAVADSSASELQVTGYPMQPRPPQIVNLTCPNANCLLHYSLMAARGRLKFRSFKIELIRQQSQSAVPSLPVSTPACFPLVPPLPSSAGPPPPSPPPFEFRVTRGAMAGVLSSGIILLAVGFTIWGYRSWQYRMYSSPLRRLLGRTPLHRLPAYSSRLFDLERLQLDRPGPDGAGSRRGQSPAKATEDEEGEEDEEVEGSEADDEVDVEDGAVVNPAFRINMG